MAGRTPQQQCDDFVAANTASPVTSGSVIGQGGEGAYFTLANRTTHRLGAEACKLLPDGFPRWDLD